MDLQAEFLATVRTIVGAFHIDTAQLYRNGIQPSSVMDKLVLEAQERAKEIINNSGAYCRISDAQTEYEDPLERTERLRLMVQAFHGQLRCTLKGTDLRKRIGEKNTHMTPAEIKELIDKAVSDGALLKISANKYMLTRLE